MIVTSTLTLVQITFESPLKPKPMSPVFLVESLPTGKDCATEFHALRQHVQKEFPLSSFTDNMTMEWVIDEMVSLCFVFDQARI